VVLLAAAGVGVVAGWVGTGPSLSLGINWDTAGYAADIASGRQGWSSPPWSSHYALGPVYAVGAALGRALGGTVLGGFRLLNAFALAATGVVLAAAARALGAGRLPALGIVLSWLAWWGLVRLVCTWEDNILFLPFAAAALALALGRAQAWRPRDSATAGVLVGVGSLISWQAAVYLAAPLYVCACFGGPDRRAARRVRDSLLLLAAFLGARIGWALFYRLTSTGLSLGGLLSTLFARPEPSYFPRGAEGWWELARAWRAVFRHLAVGVLQVAGPWWHDGPPRGWGLVLLGAFVLAVALAASVITFRQARRSGRLAGHLLVATTTALLIASALYVDLPVDKYKRYDFLPLMAALGLAAAFSLIHTLQRRWILLGPLLAVQLVLVIVSHNRFRATLASAQPPGYHTRDGETWFAFARRLRARASDRCGYLFAFSEVQHARYQLEIPAVLWSELPGAAVVNVPPEASAWRRPLPLPRSAPRGCEWVSPAARAFLP
jgi:hypothetical protein